MRWTKRTPRVTLVVLAALLAAVVISACGGSSNSGKTTTSKNAAATSTTSTTSTTKGASAFTACLKQHGVTAPNRGSGGFGFRHRTTTTGAPPTGTTPGGGYPGGGAAGGGGGAGPTGGGFASGNSKFAKAFAACRSKLGTSGFGAGRFGGAGTHRGIPQISTTVLKSYVSCIRTNGYPAMPEPKASGTGSFFPASVEKNAKFQAANKKCQSILVKAFRRTAPAQSSTTPTLTSSTTSTTSST